ncbi:sorbose reductase sou1 [Trametes coccinea BRFM310]|uniref:Sorbose reductase sou1 n=1 Tax=Trametes coccinea (strain BRFM310) TaxID=1353009 RepID=A0A1Y2IN62_TRAC3|nr:sorbose reductase sou1 [Trametes coccinea BRFM310]
MSAQDIPGVRPSYGPVGVARALNDSSETPTTTLFNKEFSLADKVALISGGNSGVGLESALAFIEAGARAVYCLDIASEPSPEWTKVKEFASRLEDKVGEGRFEYISADVSDQERIWQIGKDIGDKEGRLDICVAAAGIRGPVGNSLSLNANDFRKLMAVNLDGVLYTAQAAGQQMLRFKQGGSIILLASVLGHQSMPNSVHMSYQVAKGGVLQMTRSLAVELATKGIRVNSISPGFLRTNMMTPLFAMMPEMEAGLATLSPTGRIGEPHEIRGAVTFLASDASSWCTGSDLFVDGAHHAW